MKQINSFVPVSEIRVGAVLRFGHPSFVIRVERISVAKSDGSIGLHGNDDTWTSFYKPTDRVPVLNTSMS